MCVLQAKFWCTVGRAKRITVSLTVASLIVAAASTVCWRLNALVFDVIISILETVFVPVAVLVLNAVVAVQARRAASNAPANLGVQPHHQTLISNNSAVPTVMLIATSIIYAFFCSTYGILYAVWWWIENHAASVNDDVLKIFVVTHGLLYLVFTYNFYVYLITGRKFRAELRKLFSRCLPSTSSSSTPATSAAAIAISMFAAGSAVSSR